MKKANEIIAHLLAPYEHKLSVYRCLTKIISLMPPIYKKYITSSVVKGETLYFQVSHPGIKQELYYKRKMIFDIIKMLKAQGLCQNLNIKKIVTIHKYAPPPKPPKEIKFYIRKVEDFEIKAKDEKIRKKFEEIKEVLKTSYQ